MAKLMPLGILSGMKKALSWATGTLAGTAIVNYAAAYSANITNKYQVFGEANGGGGTNIYKYSTSGDTGSWTASTLPSSRSWKFAVSDGTKTLLIGDSRDGLHSVNGTTWTATSPFTTGILNGLVHDGTRFLAVNDQSTNNISYSTDAVTWTRITIGSGALTRIGYDSSTATYFIAKAATDDEVWKCTSDPTVPGNWSLVDMGSAIAEKISIVYGNGTWIVAARNEYYYSTNGGTTWTLRSFSPIMPDNRYNLFFANGRFYYGTLNNIYSSEDGITWENAAVGTVATRAWIYDGTKLLGFGSGSTTTLSTNDYLIGS